MNDSNLGQYLNNHLAGAVAGIELLKMAIHQNHGSRLGDFLERLFVEMEEDREVVRRVVKETGNSEDLVKKMGAWMLEKVASVRLSDFAGSSPHLRRVVELEGILIGTHGRIGMWRLLELHCSTDRRLGFADFSFLRQRAEGQARELEQLREEAATAAFSE